MKFPVTDELAKLLKTLRVQRGIPAKDLAERLGKSPSYLSKLEGGAVRTIDKDALAALLGLLVGGVGFYEDVLPAAVRALRGIADDRALSVQLWLLHFDVVERPVDVPPAMARDMAANFAVAGADARSIAELLDANVDSELSDAFPVNQMVAIDYEGTPRLMARVSVSPDHVDAILSGRESRTTYFLLYNIVHAMFRMRAHPRVSTKLPPDDAARILRAVATYLGRWNIHSLTGFSHLISSDDFIARQAPLAAGSAGVVERISAKLAEVVAHDPLHAINQLNAFLDTLEWDPAFALQIAGLPLAELGEVSFANKRRLLERIRTDIDELDQMDDFDKRIERY